MVGLRQTCEQRRALTLPLLLAGPLSTCPLLLLLLAGCEASSSLLLLRKVLCRTSGRCAWRWRRHAAQPVWLLLLLSRPNTTTCGPTKSGTEFHLLYILLLLPVLLLGLVAGCMLPASSSSSSRRAAAFA
jgi:hypothetical protein